LPALTRLLSVLPPLLTLSLLLLSQLLLSQLLLSLLLLSLLPGSVSAALVESQSHHGNALNIKAVCASLEHHVRGKAKAAEASVEAAAEAAHAEGADVHVQTADGASADVRVLVV